MQLQNDFYGGDFNPRSLTGATLNGICTAKSLQISIHAPSRERLLFLRMLDFKDPFQSTLPHGSDSIYCLQADGL